MNPKGESWDSGRQVCNYLHQARGVNCTPGQVIVGAGSDYILMLLGMILGREHVVAFENPTYKQAYRLFRGLAYKTVPVGMDKNGMKVTELSDSGADIAYVTPSHQYPTGIIMPIGRRMELLKWAKEEPDRYVIEDDYDSEFRIKGNRFRHCRDMTGTESYLSGTFQNPLHRQSV